MKIVFMGTPDYAIPSLDALWQGGYEIAGVFTQPDKPSGRGNKTEMSPVKKWALEKGLPVWQPQKIRLESVGLLRDLAPDVCVTAAFGQILSRELLDIPRLGTVNVHASLLPEFRGSSPVAWCLMEGRTETGVTTMMTDPGIDTGDILMQEALEIDPEDTAGTLTDKLAVVGARLLLRTLRALEDGTCPRTKQDESRMSYYPKLTKEMSALKVDRTAEEIRCQVRALDPWPGTVLMAGEEPLKIWRVSCTGEDTDLRPGTVLCADPKNGFRIATGKGVLEITELQARGGKRMKAADYLRGHRIGTETVGDE